MGGIEFNGSYPMSPEMVDMVAELAEERGVSEKDMHAQLATIRDHLAKTAEGAIDLEEGENDD